MLVGYGRVGRHIAAALSERGIPFVVAEQNREIVERLRAAGHRRRWRATRPMPVVLIQAHIAQRADAGDRDAADTFQVRQMVETARTLNPAIEVVVRSHNEEEAALLERDNAGKVFVGETELARAMTEFVLGKVERPS